MKQLDQGEDARLTLVVASAGAGKTALLADWSATHSPRVPAWLSCDPGDNDPTRFVAALIEALRRSSGEPRLGADALQLLTAERAVSADVIAALADDVEQLDARLVAIIDDFHLTGHGGVEVLSWLLESRPENLQVVIATRVDPALRLHRMRASCELVEVRERALAFSIEESTALLARFGVQLDDTDVAEVQRRSEGWAAGLQMTAISIQHGVEPNGVANRVEFDRHAVTGYFLSEVLYRQPERVARFMLATSILDELSASACTALCGEDAAELLERTYRDHLFVSLFDEASGGYRYHPLIKEVLRAELRARDPQRERQLHRRAARHLADRGRAGPAARHLLDGGDAGSAFQLLSDGHIADFGTSAALGSALDDIQPDDFAGHPEILVPLASELLMRGTHTRGARAFALACAADVERASPSDLAFRFAVVGSKYHLFRGELDEALAYRDQGHHIVSQTAVSHDWLVDLDAIGAVCHMLFGNFDEALQLVEEEAAAVAARWPAAEVFCLSARGHMALVEGVLSDADGWADRSLEAAGRAGFDRHPSAFFALRTKALLALERTELGRAAELTERTLDAEWPFLSFLAQLDRARIWGAEGNLDEALASLPAVRGALHSDRSILLAEADELEARLRLALGDASGAMTIVERLPDRRSGVIAAMIHLQTGQPEQALAALDAVPPQQPTVRSDLELQLLCAEVALGRHLDEAPRLIRALLDVAARHGFVQTILDTAPQLVEHLISDSDLYPRSEHLAALVSAGVDARQRTPMRTRAGPLVDPLTEAEIRVLRKISQRLTYGEVALDLQVSLNTVKTHLRHSYMKLGVTSRSAAIKRAMALGLL